MFRVHATKVMLQSRADDAVLRSAKENAEISEVDHQNSENVKKKPVTNIRVHRDSDEEYDDFVIESGDNTDNGGQSEPNEADLAESDSELMQ